MSRRLNKLEELAQDAEKRGFAVKITPVKRDVDTGAIWTVFWMRLYPLMERLTFLPSLPVNRDPASMVRSLRSAAAWARSAQPQSWLPLVP
ncbi:hypothetical protein [Lactimicrobium massiliense]|uniref:hypothetical protein n=1 Tax=Lactimicrobium massiliense TaxID=2161814 RepID=UPI000D562A73|nr:hypothetical protein [Lactimicrobium massiliense]